MKTPPIRVLLVDDHPVIPIGLNFILKTTDDLQPVGTAANVTEALAQCAALQPDVVLMDLKMATNDDGIEATACIHQRFPQIRVIILTSFYDQDLVARAMQAGAVGYLLKDVSMAELTRAIRHAHADELIIAPKAAQSLQQAPHPIHSLTTRQRQVLILLTQGLSNREIAQQLGVALPTARHHVSMLLARLGVANRAAAAALAAQHGLGQS